MNELMLAVVTSLVLGIVVNEITETSPWLARRLMRWAARRRYSDPALRDERAEEWAALIDERPGKFLKLFTAAPFALVALVRPHHGRRAASAARLRMPFAVAAAAIAIVTSGVTVWLHAASTDTLAAQRADQVRATIHEANIAIRIGDAATARSLVDTAAGQVGTMSDDGQREELGQEVTRIRNVVAAGGADVPGQMPR